MSTKSRALFLYCNAGHTPPDAYLKKVFIQYPSWSGLAFIDGNQLIWSQDNKGASLEGFKALREDPERKDKAMFFAFGREENIDASVAEDDANLQPWQLISVGEGDNEEDKVILFVDGPLEHYAKNDAPEGRPYLFVGHRMQATIHELWDDAGKDVEKFVEKLRKPHNIAAIEGMVGEDGAVVIMTPTDKGFMYYGNPTNGDEFPWGFTNDTLGYKEAGATTAVTNKTKNQLRMSTAGTVVEAKEGDKHLEVQYLFRPNANIIKTAQLKEIYTKYTGRTLSNNQMQQRQAAPVIPDMLAEAKADDRITLSIIGQGTSPVTVIKPDATKVAEQVADVTEKAALKKFVDANVLEVMSPEEMEKNELPKPTFWDQTGWKIENFIHAKNLDKILDQLTLGAKYKKDLELLINDLRYALFQSEKDVAAATELATAAENKAAGASVASATAGKNRFKMSSK